MPKDDVLLDQLKTYLQSLGSGMFGISNITDVNLKRLNSGLHNVNYLLTFNDSSFGKFVLRFHPNNTHGQDKTAVEAANMRLLDGLPVPRLLWVDRPNFLDSSIIIMDFVGGEHKNLNELTASEAKTLARTVALMHQKKSPTYSPSWGAAPTEAGDYSSYLKSTMQSTILNPLQEVDTNLYADSAEMIQETLSRIETEIVKTDFTGKSFSLLHTDIGTGNIIWNENKLTLIDWEEVTFGDPADEVAYIFAINNLSQTIQATFLQEYLVHCSDKAFTARLPLYTLKNRLFDLVWSIGKLHQQASGQESELMYTSPETYRRYYDERREALAKPAV